MSTVDPSGGDPLADPRVFQAIEEYQIEVAAGRRPDHAAFVARFPEVAGPLAGCLRGLDLVAATVTPEPTPTGANRLGDFRIVREVGRGGMGVVYEAEQLSLGRRVALKVVAGVPDDRTRQRFQNEAHAAASLSHPHIVPVHVVGCDGDTLFLAMRFVEGRSLAALVRRFHHPNTPAETPRDVADETRPYTPPATPPELADPPPFPAPPAAEFYRTVARLAAGVADALQHAHDFGIVHRDIKPGNLLLEPNGHLWVADFGLARLSGAADLTRTGEMIGTLRYMSPEQAGGAAVDHRTDVYSLGATLYELLTLRPAFPGSNPQDLIVRIKSEEPPSPRSLAPAVPRDLETVVLKAMAKEPAERYATAGAFADDLRRFLDDRPVLARRPTAFDRVRKWARRNRRLVSATLGVLFAFLAFAVVGLLISAEQIDAEREKTARANDALTGTNAELGRTVGALNQANVHLSDALRQARQAEYTYKFLAARREWGDGNFARALDLLRECPPECRRWEWGYLGQLLSPGLCTLPTGASLFSPDGLTLVSYGKAIHIWDCPPDHPPTKPRHVLVAPKYTCLCATFTPDGKHLVTAGYDGQQPAHLPIVGELHVWDVGTGELVRSVGLPGKPLALNPTGTRVLCSARLTAQLVDTADGRPVAGFQPVPATVLHAAAFSPSGKYISIGDSKSGQLYSSDTGQLVRTLADPRGAAGPVAFSPDERFGVTITQDGVAKLWELDGGREWFALPGRFTRLAKFAPDGRRFATTAPNGTITLWSISTKKNTPPVSPVHTYHGPNGSLAFHPDGVRLVAGGVVWDLTSAQEGRSLPNRSLPDRPTLRYGLTPAEGRRLILPGLLAPPKKPSSTLIRVLDLDTGRELPPREDKVARVVSPVRGSATCPALGAPDGLYLSSALPARDWNVWNMTTGRDLFPLDETPISFAFAEVSPDGATIALVAHRGKVVRLVDVATGHQRTELDVGGTITTLAFHPRANRVAVGADRTLRLFDTDTGNALHTLTGHTGAVNDVAFHPGGRLLASVGAEGTARVWDADAGELVRVLAPHTGQIKSLAFDPSGDRLAASCSGGEVRLWDPLSGEEYLVIPSERSPRRLTFTPDGEHLIGDFLVDIVVWDSKTASTEVRFARLAAREREWRELEAAQHEGAGDWFPAAFHLERLAALDPKDAALQERLTKARAALAKP